jgi:hypothetical protein
MKASNLNTERPIAVWYSQNKVTYQRFKHPITYEEATNIGKQKGYEGQPFVCASILPKTHIKKALKDLINGIIYRYPPCCITQFSLDTLMNRPIQAILRYTDTVDYVPCNHHIRSCKKPIPEGTF